MLRVKKRDGSIVDFDLKKIENAMSKAFDAEHVDVNSEILERLALRVSSDVQPKIKDQVVGVEDIQDSVEVVLIESGYVQIARSYMDYRKKHEELHHTRTLGQGEERPEVRRISLHPVRTQ